MNNFLNASCKDCVFCRNLNKLCQGKRPAFVENADRVCYNEENSRKANMEGKINI